MEVTVAKVFQETSRIYHDRPAYKSRKDGSYHAVTYGETYERVRNLGTGLQSLGIKPGEKVGIISDNRPEWIVCDLSCICIGAADVPRGSDSTLQEIDYILSHSDAVASFVENGAQLDKILPLRPRLPTLRFLVVMDPGYDGPAPEGVYRLQEVEERGRALLEEGDNGFEEALVAVKATDLATLIYTSGTTGEPKGVMLSHRNLMQNIEVLPAWIGIGKEDRFLSILPPWHIFERMVEYIVMASGASLAYTSIRTFVEDMALEKPTFLPSVPRIWEGIYSKVIAKIDGEPQKKRKIFYALVGVSLKFVKARKVLQGRDTLWVREGSLQRSVTWLR